MHDPPAGGTSRWARLRDLDEARALDLLALLCAALVAAYLAVAVVLALLLPIHSHDALGFGQLSRLIGLHGGFEFPAVPDVVYHRPLFYVLQGELWHVFGFHETLGRLLSLAFCLLLLGCMILLALRLPRGRLVAALALALLLCSRSFVQDGFSGLTDVPVAALIALCGLLVWRDRGERWRPPAIVLAAAAAGFSKPTALTALVGLALSQLVGARGRIRERVVRTVFPLALGAEVALYYDARQAARFHERLGKFLTAGTSTDVYARETHNFRFAIGELLGWLGPALRPLLVFAIAYAIARVVGAQHRRAAFVAGPVAIVLSVLGPYLAFAPHSFSTGPFAQRSFALSWLLFAGVFALAPFCPEEEAPSRSTLARLLIWGGVPLLAWLIVAPIAQRLLSPAWPALFLLLAVTLVPAVVAAVRLRPWLVVVPAAAIAVVVASNALNIEQLGPSGWRGVAHFVRTGDLTNRDAARAAVLPKFQAALERSRPLLGPRDRLLTNEGNFKFFYPGRVSIGVPQDCSRLEGIGLLAWDLDPVEKPKKPYDPSSALHCDKPHAVLVSAEGGYRMLLIIP